MYVKKPISFEVFADNPKEILNKLIKLIIGKNVYVIPVVNSKGYLWAKSLKNLVIMVSN